MFKSLLSETRTFPPHTSSKAHLSSWEEYQKEYAHSIEENDAYWLKLAESLDWIKKPTIGCKYRWDTKGREVWHRWFEDGKLNVTVNCLDRHLAAGKGNKTALIWQGDRDEEVRHLTYQELYSEVCRCAYALREKGIKKGDRICLYMPNVPELVVAVLASARIGAIHSVVFGGFSAEALAQRINDSECKALFTSNVTMRGGKEINLKKIADEALESCPSIETVVVLHRYSLPCNFVEGRDISYDDFLPKKEVEAPAEIMDAEDPLFILYTSGSTGAPKGVVHSQAGYLLYASYTHKLIFDIHDDDVYWCTADIGWVTGHSYVIYGPLCNGATSVMFEGIPTYPDAGRFWQIVEKFQVTAFYTAPTAIRAVMCHGNKWPEKYDLSSLRVLGTVGEPINPEAWVWYYEAIGKKKRPIVDTWWQTETGGILLTPLPFSHTLKPGSATRPFFGIEPLILHDDHTPCGPNEGGSLCIRYPWPAMMRTMWGDHERFIDTYFSQHPNLYFSGDGAYRDEDGDIWILGRVDDVLNISGHRLGTAEVESALVSHPSVSEAAIASLPHPIKGEGIHAYVILMKGTEASATLGQELKEHVRKVIGPIAIPEAIHFTTTLPKTRSGKIMRRILRKIAAKDLDNLGDTTTLAEPGIVQQLIAEDEEV